MKTKYVIEDRAIAADEVAQWQEYIGITPMDLEDKEPFTKVLVEAVMMGFITIDQQTGVLTQTLKKPLTNPKGVVTLEKLEYNPRITTGDLIRETKGLKAGMEAFHCYAAGLTGEAKATLDRLMPPDFRILQSVTTFFQ